MRRLTQIRIPIDQSDRLRAEVARRLGVPPAALGRIRVVKRSLDARNKRRPVHVYTVEVFEPGEAAPDENPRPRPVRLGGRRPVIVGAGPAGLFAALRFAEYGVACTVLDQGAEIRKRSVHVARFWKRGELNPWSNVCFGEGGAGLFSDGKLNTRIRSPFVHHVLESLVAFGAPPETRFVHNPHVGSDHLRRVIRNLVAHLRQRGCTFRFETRVVGLLLDGSHRVAGVELAGGEHLETERVVLAPGHSARAFYRTLFAQGVAMEAKDFAMGVRVEHPQALIDRIRLGPSAEKLGPAEYRLTYRRDDVRAYTFCMCPGGYVVSAGTEADGVVVNGMSNRRRNTRWANAALVVPVTASKIPGDDPFRCLALQRSVERRAWEAVQEVGGGHALPGQRLVAFLDGRRGNPLPRVSSPSGAVTVDLEAVLPGFVVGALREALPSFDRRMRGFLSRDAVVLAVESRTSAPIRLTRRADTRESVNTPGLFPVGEGAGYAGGIVSSAVDAVRTVETIVHGIPEQVAGTDPQA